MTADKSGNRRFEVALHFSGKCVNQAFELSDMDISE
jgi:hypothetical protein